MLSRTISGPDIDTEETWAWNESNVCVSHTALDKTPAPAQFGEGAMNETKTAITVSNIGGDISEYHIHKTIEYKEYGIGIKGVIPNQQTVIGKYTTRTEETNIQRNADGSGEKETIVEEAARNRYYAVMTLPVYDDSNNITGSKEIQIPYFDFYKRLPESKERTVYRRKDGRPYSVTQTWKAKMNVTGLEDAYISLVPDTVSYGTEEPEQPEMEEAVETISAEVEYIIEFDQDIGTYERSETLPDIPIPEVVLNSKQLYDWLWNRAKKYANRKRRQFMLLDEMTIRGRLRDDIEIGWKVGEFTVTGVRHSVSADTVETAITGVRPSVQTVPLRRSANAMSMLIKTAREMDKAQDNIRQAQVVRPVSSRRALANIGGKNYVVANPKGGPLFAGDKISVYRETGSAKEGA